MGAGSWGVAYLPPTTAAPLRMRASARPAIEGGIWEGCWGIGCGGMWWVVVELEMAREGR